MNLNPWKRFALFSVIFVLCCCGCPRDNNNYEYEISQIYGGYGDGPGQFDRPTDVVLRRVSDPLRSSLFVADYGNNRIQIFSPALYQTRPDTIIVIQEPFSDTIKLFPASLTVTQSVLNDLSAPVPDNPYIYVADSKNNRIMVYDLNGNLHDKWGNYGSDTGQFISPTGIDMDFEGNVYVVDSGNHRVQVFDTLGNFLRMWGQKGNDVGQFISPISLTVCFTHRSSAVFKYVAVSDWGNNRIQVFDRNGNVIKIITGIPQPTGITHNGHIIDVISSKTGMGYKIDGTTFEVLRTYILLESDKPFGIYASDFDLVVSDIGNNRVAYYFPTTHP